MRAEIDLIINYFKYNQYVHFNTEMSQVKTQMHTYVNK